MRGRVGVAAALLAAGAEIDARSNDGSTALILVCDGAEGLEVYMLYNSP